VIHAIDDILARAPVIPVVTVESAADAPDLVRALAAGGLPVVEITLRSPAALDAIREASSAVPEAIVGAGTIRSARDYEAACDSGAAFAVSPGLLPAILDAAANGPAPLLPGVATASEILQAGAAGYTRLKFFPAEAAGGRAALKALAGPFPDVVFCPTGGITPEAAPDYLALSNVICVGGSWMLSNDALTARDWDEIARLARAAAALGSAR